MPYTELLRRSLHIAWRNRWLWLLALFAGEAGGGGGSGGFGGNPFPRGNLGQGGQTSPATGLPDLTPVRQWVQDHAGLLVAAALVLVVVWIAFFIFSCACAAAEVRAVQEIDAGRPSGLRRAWSLGRERFMPVLRLRLVLLLLGLAVLVGLGLIFAAGLVLALAGNFVGLLVVVWLGTAALFTLLVAAFALSVMLPVALRSAVLEGQPGWRALRRAYGLTMARPGRVLACWGLMVACQIGYGLVVGIAAVVVALPALAAVGTAFAAGQLVLAIIPGVLLALVLGVVLIVGAAAFGAFYSTFWTLAFSRLETA
jgi:hypothetical protein